MMTRTFWIPALAALALLPATPGHAVPPTKQEQELLLDAAADDAAGVKALLAKGVSLSAADSQGQTALFLAAKDGNADIVTLLQKAGADINARDNTGATPLIIAAGEAHSDVVDVLLAQKADVAAQDKKGMTALIFTATEIKVDFAPTWDPSYLTVARSLIAAGADANQANAEGVTPLMMTVLKNRPGMAQLLLTHGADANQTADTVTPLMFAADAGSPAVIKALLAHGADVNARDKDGDTALKLAQKKKRVQVVALLKQAGAKA